MLGTNTAETNYRDENMASLLRRNPASLPPALPQLLSPPSRLSGHLILPHSTQCLIWSVLFSYGNMKNTRIHILRDLLKGEKKYTTRKLLLIELVSLYTANITRRKCKEKRGVWMEIKPNNQRLVIQSFGDHRLVC